LAAVIDSDLEPIEFRVIREDWNEYELEDSGHKVRLRGRLVVTKIRLDERRPRAPGFGIGSRDIWVSFAPKELRGKPTLPPPTQEEIEANIIVPEVPFRAVRETWNEYDVENKGIVRVKPVLIRVSKTSLYAVDGDPLYLIRSDNVTDFISLKPKATQGHPTLIGTT
jgi:hypothetical protein